MSDAIDKGLQDCSDGIAYADHSPGEAAAMAAYAVLRCCGLITAGTGECRPGSAGLRKQWFNREQRGYRDEAV